MGRQLTALSAGVIGVCALASCQRAPQNPDLHAGAQALEGGGVRLERVRSGGLPAAPSLGGEAGDWLLQGAGLRAVVGAANDGAARALSRGALLDLASGELTRDALEELHVVAFEGGRELALRVRSISPVTRAGRPALLIEHGSRDDRFRMTTELSIVATAHGASHLQLETALTTRGTATRVRLGDRVRFAAQPPFAPGFGDVSGAARARLPWFGVSSRQQSYALVFDAPAAVVFGASRHGPEAQLALGPELTLAPGQAARHSRRLLAVAADRLALAEAAYQLSDVPVGHAVGQLQPAPRWATLEALDARGQRHMNVQLAPSPVRFRLPLPPGEYTLVLRTPGGVDSEPVRIEAGEERAVALLVPVARRLRYRVTAGGEPTPARLLVTGIPPTQNPSLGPPHTAAGAGNATYTGRGEGEVELAPGRYRVVATHGPEFTIAEREIDVTERAGATLRLPLERAFEPRGWLACDFHLHADPSGDSDVSLQDRITSLLAEGVEFAVATDHNLVTNYAPAVEALDAGAQITTASGVEITTGEWGHFNAYPYAASEPPPHTLAPAELFAAARERSPGVLIQVNHPRMGDIGYFNRGGVDALRGSADAGRFSFGFDTIEVLNGFESDLGTIVRNLSDWFGLLNQGMRYTAVGNSDSHTVDKQWAGYPRTYVFMGESGARPQAEAVRDALRAGRAVVSSGPFIDLRIGGAQLGDTVRIEKGRASVELVVHVAPWVQIEHVVLVVNGRPVRALPAAIDGQGRMTYTTELDVSEDGWLVAVAWGSRRLETVLRGGAALPFGFTNPIYLDADGDGAVRMGPKKKLLQTANWR